MKRKRHTPEQIVSKLRAAQADLAAGMDLAAVCQKMGVSEQTYYRWQKEYGGIKANQVRRLKELEKENARLKKALADAILDQAILKEALKGNY
jgi:transposase-like protein